MASLSANPLGADFEDLVSAHLAARGMYVETGVTERNPRDILELDVVWTDYRGAGGIRNALEIKSGGWGLHDYFKFFGWLTYLDLKNGAFVYRDVTAQAGHDVMQRLATRTGLKAIHIANLESVDATMEEAFGLPRAPFPFLTEVWRYSFWAQRLLLRSLSKAIEQKVCPEAGKVAKDFIKLINDATFFEPDVRTRVSMLLGAHMKHRHLGRSAALEIEGKAAVFENPENSIAFSNALYAGKHVPIQACLYVGHRGRLAVLKAAVDYILAKRRGDLPKNVLKVFGVEIDLGETDLHNAFKKAVEFLEAQPTHHQYAVFWQVFLWAWGGFILDDRRDEEYAALSLQTGVPVNEINAALSLFDHMFPLPSSGSWFKTPKNDSRAVLTLMPAVIRGVGAYHRLLRAQKKEYHELDFKDSTTRRIAQDHNGAASLLDGGDAALLA